MPQPERVFLDWSEPMAKTAARWLLDRRPATHGRDLSDMLVIVPTRRAARRLREELATAAPGGVLSPQTITPARLLQPGRPGLAEPIEATLAFLAALEKIPPPALTALFPHGIPFRSFEERTHFARTFFDLRASLTDAGFHLQSAARALSDSADAERWNALAIIEQAYLDTLRREGRRDREAARLAMAADPSVFGAAREIVLIGITDLTLLAARALSARPDDLAPWILIPAPRELAESFDPWGRPLVEAWNDRDPGWENFDAQVHLCARAEDIAATVTAILPDATKPDPAFLEIGALDRNLLPWLRASLESAGGALHDPEGESLDRHWLGRLLNDWAAFLADASFPTVCKLLRNGAIAAWLTRHTPRFELAAALAEADTVRAGHFPSTAAHALDFCKSGGGLQRALERLLSLRSRMREPDGIGALRPFFEGVASAMADVLPDSGRRTLDLAVTGLATALDQIEPLLSRYAEVATSDWLRLARSHLATLRSYAEPEPGSVEASGWLELPWSDAPHLVLAGFNQGIVPARQAQDSFLLPVIRQRLGLSTEAERAARDAYFLARLLAMRRGGSGRVDVLVCQIDTEGSPGQPSSLLFAGSGAALPKRVQRLFAEPRPAEADPAWEAAWVLDPPVAAMEKRLRVTGFRDYLACPFEFYLRFGLEMEHFDPEPMEMDARVFGTLVHDTLEAFSKTEALRDLCEAGKIHAAVSEILDGFVENRFEMPLSLPLLVQVESARQRLMAFAKAEAAQRSDGWRTAHAEITFSDYLGGRSWLLDGWEIRGKIDRVDHHAATGRWRVLDYKTSDKAEPPHKAHVRGGIAATHTWPPDYAIVDETSSKAPKWWSNLQLPLYRQLLIEAGHEPGSISCGYFNLPKAASATGVAEWADFGNGLGASALRCARGVLADIDRGHFWPPNPRAAYPQNAGWFHPDPERTVARDAAIRSMTA